MTTPIPTTALPPTPETPSSRPDTPAPAVLRWGPLGAFALLLLALARHAGEGISDPDTLWHILAGDHLWATGQFAGPDSLSHFTTGPWILHEWLPELGLALANHLGGLAAVAWLAQAGRLAVCLALLVLCRRVAGPLAAALVAGAAILGTADSLSPRPQLVGFVFLAVTVGAWLRTAMDNRPRWWLVPLSWLWACSHGTWVVGITVGVATVAGLALDGRLDRKQAARLAAIPVLSLVAAALTPVGPRLFESFVTIRAVSPYISEWRTPTLSSMSVLATGVLAVAIPLLWLVRRKRVSWTQAGLWACGVAWAAMSMRSVALGVIILAPLAAEALDAVLGRPRSAPGRREWRFVGAAAALSLVLAGLLAAAGPRTPTGVPHRLDASLSALPAGSVVYNTDRLGGWLMWSHPALTPTSDTRVELYGPTRSKAYLAILNARPGWTVTFDAYHPAAALIEEHTALATALLARGWKRIGSDGDYVLIEPPAR